MRTLHRFSKKTAIITAPRTRDLLRWTRFRNITELRFGEEHVITTTRWNDKRESNSSETLG